MSIAKHAGNPATGRITGPEAMLDAIRELGIVPFFENSIPGYSIEEMTPASNWFDGEDDLRKTPWDWKIHCVQSGEIAYGKFLFGGKAAFATIEWYRELRRWRQSLEKYRPDEPQKKILGYLEENGSIGIKEVRGLLGVKKGQADAQISRLMMQCRVVTGDIGRVYRGEDLHYNGWQVSSFCTPEDLFGTDSLDVDHSPQEARARLLDHIAAIAPAATEAAISAIL